MSSSALLDGDESSRRLGTVPTQRAKGREKRLPERGTSLMVSLPGSPIACVMGRYQCTAPAVSGAPVSCTVRCKAAARTGLVVQIWRTTARASPKQYEQFGQANRVPDRMTSNSLVCVYEQFLSALGDSPNARASATVRRVICGPGFVGTTDIASLHKMKQKKQQTTDFTSKGERRLFR